MISKGSVPVWIHTRLVFDIAWIVDAKVPWYKFVLSQIPCHEAGEEDVNNICVTANSWFYRNWFIQKNVHLIHIECFCCTLLTASIRKVPSNNVCIDIFVLLSLKSLLWKLFYLFSKRPIETAKCVCNMYFSVTEQNILIIFFQIYVQLFTYSLQVWRTEYENGTW
jgi:hypothetical protein